MIARVMSHLTIRRMRIACWIHKATNTHTLRMCNTHCSALQQYLHQLAPKLR